MSIYAVILEQICDNLYYAYRACDEVLPTPYDFYCTAGYYQRKWKYVSIPTTNLMYFLDNDTKQLYNSLDDDSQYRIRVYLRLLNQHRSNDGLIGLINARQVLSGLIEYNRRNNQH